MRLPFLRGVVHGTLPLWIWAAQFAFGYGWAAVACQLGADASWVRGPIVVVTAVALAAAAWLLWRACASHEGGLLATARSLSALLALIGIGWGVVPVLWLEACRIG